MKIRKEHFLLILILIVGAILRILKFSDPAIEMDVVAFSRLGKNLIENGKYVFGENYNMGVFFPPGYPIFIGLVNLLLNDLFLSAKIVSFIAGIISILLSYLIGRELYNKKAGLFAAFVYAIYPVILIISVDGYSDALFFCFMLLSIYIFIASLRKDSLILHVLLGISLALSYLTRAEGMFLLLLPVLRVFNVFDRIRTFNKTYLFNLCVILIVFILGISPYLIFLKNYTGRLTMSGKDNISILLGELSGDSEYDEMMNGPDNLYDKAAFTLNEKKNQLNGWNREVNRSLKEYVLKDPVNFIKKYLKNILREIKVLIKHIIPIIFPLLFSFFNKELFKNKMMLIFLIYALLFFFMYPLFMIIEKQTLLITLFLILFSCGGFQRSQSAVSEIASYYTIRENRIVKLIEKGIKFLIIIVLIISSLSYIKFSSFENVLKPVEHEMAGLYLEKNISAGYEKLNVMAKRPYVSFYSDSRFTMLPYANTADVIHFGKLYNVDYIVIDKRFLGKWDFYNELIEMHKHSNEVELFYEDASDSLIRLFKIKS